jgi:hypothetical protein
VSPAEIDMPACAPLSDDFAAMARRDSSAAITARPLVAPVLATLHGFDLMERAEVTGLPGQPGLRCAARSTVALRHAQIGASVLVVFENGDVSRPIILGVIEPQGIAPTPSVTVQVDGERQLIEAEREIVLRCGEASITLTRAGKVIIKGSYILSRSSGYNKIKGAAIDIN